MTHKGIDEYSTKTGIATKDQLNKSNAILEPIKLSLGFSFKEQTQEIEDIQTLRDDLKRLNEGMNLMGDNLTKIERERQSFQVKIEIMTFHFYCPDLRKDITSIDCEKASTNNLCKYGKSCAVRNLEFKRFFELE